MGDPLRMALTGLAEEGRHPFVMEAGGRAIGVLTLQSGAATLAGWPEDGSAWLLRGFLVDRRHQGKGLGTLGAAAAVVAAGKLERRHPTGASGVVLSVNEANGPGLAAYLKAGFVDHGRYTGGSAGPQRTLFMPFAQATMTVTPAGRYCVGKPFIRSCGMAVFFNLVGGKARTVFVSGGIRQEARLPVSARLEPGSHLLTTPGIRPGNAKGGHRITGGRLCCLSGPGGTARRSGD